ncbi:MAG TPA: GlsB/YeaQ/YmgE family stress response membrane protein [Casimicrobiaceae bacterium]|nr:GlsB/YeaQ/YmgE family stress response membrane protein [Casimicrobiaceae bacterium]
MGLMGFIWMLVIGLIVGALARFFYPGPVAMGWLATLVLGVVGSLVGGLIGSMFSRGRTGFQPAGIIMSVIGAVLVLWLYLTFMR